VIAGSVQEESSALSGEAGDCFQKSTEAAPLGSASEQWRGYSKVGKDMQITVELSQETYEQLRRQAEAKSLSVAEVAEQMLEEAEANRRAAVFEQMRAEGILLPKKPASPETRASFKPIEVSGRPASEILIEERR